MKKYSAVIVGCGEISSVHAKVLTSATLAALGVELAGVCDTKEARAQRLADEFNVKAFTDLSVMLDACAPDVLHICLPHFLHAQAAIQALDKKIHVLTEKPMATTVADGEAMITAANKNNRTLGVIFQNRYNRGSVLIKRAVQNGDLGAIKGASLRVSWHRTADYYAASDWRGRWETEGGGAVINQSIHTFDLMNFFLGAPVTVDATIANRAHPGIEVEDIAEGVITYADGITASFYVTNYHPYSAPVSLEILGEKGRAEISGGDGVIFFKDGRKITSDDENTDSPLPPADKIYWGNSHALQIAEFYTALTAARTPEITGNDAIVTQRLVNAIYKSAKTNKPVSI